jgi:hypothetical protein
MGHTIHANVVLVRAYPVENYHQQPSTAINNHRCNLLLPAGIVTHDDQMGHGKSVRTHTFCSTRALGHPNGVYQPLVAWAGTQLSQTNWKTHTTEYKQLTLTSSQIAAQNCLLSDNRT